MTTTKSYHLKTEQIAASFSRAAHHYDKVAVLQNEVGQQMLERLDFIRMQPKVILDVGSGTGKMTRLLEKKYPQAKILSTDIAEGMLIQAKKNASWLSKQKFICADAARLPFPDH